VFILVGPSGVGKTETALGLADLLYGGERMMVTINMSEFQEKHTVSRLIGSPPGYVGYGEGGMLTEAVRQRPYTVVLLDECEKADPDVMNLFYQVFDKGMLSDGEGRLVDFKNTVIIMTSNLATDKITNMTVAAREENRQGARRCGDHGGHQADARRALQAGAARSHDDGAVPADLQGGARRHHAPQAQPAPRPPAKNQRIEASYSDAWSS
jgi:ATP-dependent Clp protease ATP-binding subunit ClpA